MKKFFLLILTLGLSIGANAQTGFDPGNPGDPNYYQTKDSTLNAYLNDTSIVSENKFIQKVSDTTFLSCVKEADNIYRFHLLGEKFNLLKAIRIKNCFGNIADVIVLNNVMYVASNNSNGASLEIISINNLFYSTNPLGLGVNSFGLDSLLSISKIKVYDSIGVKIIVGIGKDKTNPNFNNSIIKCYSFGNAKFNYNMLRTTVQGESFYDLTVTNRYIYVLSSTRTGYDIKIRRFDKLKPLLASIKSKDFTLVGCYFKEPHFKIEKLYSDNFVVGLSYTLPLTGYDQFGDLLLCFDSTLTYLKDFSFSQNGTSNLFLKDLEFSNSDSSLYVLRKEYYSPYEFNVVSKIPNILLQQGSTNVNQRMYSYSSVDIINDICLLNNRFILGIGNNDTKIHYYKGSCNFDRIDSNDCYEDIITSIFPQYYCTSSNLATLTNVIYNVKTVFQLVLYKSNYYYYTPSFSFECLPWLELQNAFDPNPGPFKSLKKETGSDKDISIYPNPASDNVIIESLYDIEKVEIYNVMGQKVYDNAVDAKSINVNVANFISGTYMAKTYTKGGLFTKKIVVE